MYRTWFIQGSMTLLTVGTIRERLAAFVKANTPQEIAPATTQEEKEDAQ